MLRALARRSAQIPSFLGSYDTYAAAFAAAGGGYPTATQVQMELEPVPIALPPHVVQTLAAISPAVSGRDFVRVLDFGGGRGRLFHELRPQLPGCALDWTVVELPEVVACAVPVDAAPSRLRFVSSCGRVAPAELDLVIASGSLQYTPDPTAQLRELTELPHRYLALTRLATADLPRHRMCLQEVPPGHGGRRHPAWIFHEASLLETITRDHRITAEWTGIQDTAVTDDGIEVAYRWIVLERT